MHGVHQDDDRPDLGPCHLQRNYEDAPVDRYGVGFLDAHPLAVLDDRLQEFPKAVEAIRGENGTPSRPAWPV